MNLTQLFSIYSQFKMGSSPFTDISGITFDSRQAHEGQVFVAIRGHTKDAHQFLPEVCGKRVAAVVVEDDSAVPKDYTGGVLKVPNTRIAVGDLAARFYGDPARSLFCVGVTGTNGKTSITYIVEKILNSFGMPTGVIGTVNHHLGDRTWPTELTSPDPVTLQKRLSEFAALGAAGLAMEVSSQALDQDRCTSVPFDVAVFTNLTRDHLDYHITMENYFQAKQRLFRPRTGRDSVLPSKPLVAIVNANDEWGARLEMGANVSRWTYGETKSDFQFQILEMSFAGTRFRMTTKRGEIEIESPLIGRHNVYNVAASIAVGVAAGASLETCANAIKSFTGVPGRLQRVSRSNDRSGRIDKRREINVLIDYAHTDDALKTVLSGLQLIKKQSRLRSRIITVFGCGGDRDKGKRPMMAKAALENSDVVFVTSDNPRTEPPIEIIQDVIRDIPADLINSKVFVEVDRSECVRRAIRSAEGGDVVLIAGKGHESYQIVGARRFAMNDYETAHEVLDVL